MNFEQDGFLSPDISEWVEENQRANVQWFELIRAVNRIAQRRLISLSVDDDDLQGMFVALLYARGLTNFQGAIVLAERGILACSRTLLRNCFEDIFYLGAVRSRPAYYQRLVEADAVTRSRIARSLLEIPQDRSGLTPAHRQALRDFLRRIPKKPPQTRPSNIERVARDAGLMDAYTTFYQGLSNDSAHPSVVSLGRHMSEQDKQFLWGPEPEQMADTLMLGCAALFYLVTGIGDPVDHTDQELEGHRLTYQKLVRRLDLSLP